jgi:hypothetical protein
LCAFGWQIGSRWQCWNYVPPASADAPALRILAANRPLRWLNAIERSHILPLRPWAFLHAN